MGKQDKKLINNLERYEEEKTKQQESKVLGRKPVKCKTNKEENTIL